MISTMTNKGEARWTIIDGAFNAERLIGFRGSDQGRDEKGLFDPR
jgi:hypothetical protein